MNKTKVSILGIASAYPEHTFTDASFAAFGRKWATDPSCLPALEKTLAIQRMMNIKRRTIMPNIESHPLVNAPDPPSIELINATFNIHGLDLVTKAAERALENWGGNRSEITHIVCTTCTSSSNPGYDAPLADRLGLSASVERFLLHGVGCAGGLSAIRLASQLCRALIGARVLVCAVEITTTLARAELAELVRLAEPNFGIILFGDGAGACVVGSGDLRSIPWSPSPPPSPSPSCSIQSNGINTTLLESQQSAESENVIFEIQGWETYTIPDTREELGFTVNPLGWRIVLSPRVPMAASSIVSSMFRKLVDKVYPAATETASIVETAETEEISETGGENGEERRKEKSTRNGVHTNGLEKVAGTLPQSTKTTFNEFKATSHATDSHLYSQIKATQTSTTPTTPTTHLNSNIVPNPNPNQTKPRPTPQTIDWAIHPGGAKVLTLIESQIGLSPDQTRASWNIYRRYGNTSSATIFGVLGDLVGLGLVGSDGSTGPEGPEGDQGPEGLERTEGSEGPKSTERTDANKRAEKGAREDVCAVAFGPGVLVEMFLLKTGPRYRRVASI